MINTRLFRVFLAVLWITALLLPSYNVGATRYKQDSNPQDKAKQVLAGLSPEERVGQLFLITFQGKDTSRNSQIYDLISKKKIGGVVLRSANNNFIGPENTVIEAYNLNKALQTIAWQSALENNRAYSYDYIPLFIGVSQEGDGSPHDQILNGVTQLPNQMSIGATWDTKLAEKVGNVLGSELQAMGFNLLLGPSLDVLDVTQKVGGPELGTRAFGSDPYWVGKLGQAYIYGIHKGSQNHVAVLAKHFPGRGGSDRPPEEEVATVRKSLEQLKQIELAPFFEVTRQAADPESTADGLLVSHIRYQGFQGNIRATTRPVSFDQAALGQIMAIDTFAAWRANGGIIVSDDLGSTAVRKFYDPTGQTFNARQAASNAFLAGNDLLYMDNFIGTGDTDTYSTIIKTLEYFAQKYREDAAFAQRVDISVERLLTLKFVLYPDFNIENVVPPQSSLENVGKSQAVAFEVAQKAVTLISPDLQDLKSILPRPPEQRERILFITNIITRRQCKTCPEQTVFPSDALQSAVLKLYGPKAGEIVISGRLPSYTFSDLANYLDKDKLKTPPEEGYPIENDLQLADWIVFSSLDIDKNRPNSDALKRFLTEKPNLIRNKRIIVFAFNAPFYLDATDISKLSAYYGLYSKGQAFIDVAARVLFQELTPSGALPVSVPEIGYNIITATSPDSNQIIPLQIDTPEQPTPQPAGMMEKITVQPTTSPSFKVGDSIPLRTGIIYDHNHNNVPDGTVARFIFTLTGESGTTQQIETTTSHGIARASYRIQSPGLLEIRVVSEPAMTSEILRLDIPSQGIALVTALAPPPTGVPTNTPVPSATATLEPTPTPTPQFSPRMESPVHVSDWILSLLLSLFSTAGVFWMGQNRLSTRWGVRWGLLALIGGLLSFTYLASGLPGSDILISNTGLFGTLSVVLIGVLLGWWVGWLWERM